MMTGDGDSGARSTLHRAGSTRRGERKGEDAQDGNTRTTLHFCDPEGQVAICYRTATRGGHRLVCIAKNCPYGHKPCQRADLDRGHYVKSPPGKELPAMYPTYRSPAITIGVVMVKSVVYYYELRICVLAVWPSPDGSGICSPYTGDRGP